MDEIVDRISKVPVAQRVLVLIFAVVVLVFANYFLFVDPIQTEIDAANAKIKTLDGQLAKKRLIARNISRYRVEVERLKQRLNEALTLLPNEAEIPELLQKIAALVEQSDCEMATFEPQGEREENFFARLPVKMSIEGNYHSVAVFFDKISKLARIVNVTDIVLSAPKLENKKVVLKADFIATTFKFIEPKKPVGGTPAFPGAPVTR